MNSLSAQIQRIARLPLAESTPGACIRGWLVWCGLSTVVLGGLYLVPALAQPATNEAVQQAMRQGAEAMTAGNFSAAITAYTTVTQKMPKFAEGYLNLGLALQQAGQLDEARTALEKALRLKPSLRGAHLFLGTIAYKQNRLKEAEENFLGETRLDPRSAKAFMWLGVCRLAENEPEAAIVPLDAAYRLDPSDIDTLYHRGRAYLLVANASYTAMFKLDPDSVRVHQVLAEADSAAFRTGEAVTQYEIAVKMAPRQSGLHESLGDQYWISGDQDKAAEAYRTELEIDPDDAAARFKLGCLQVVHGSPAEGVTLLSQALREDPALSDAHYYLGNGLSDMDRNEEAAREYELAIAADPANNRAISSYYRLSQVYRKLHRLDDAQKALASYQELKAQVQAHQDTRIAQIIRKRSQLPVEDPEKISGTAGK